MDFSTVNVFLLTNISSIQIFIIIIEKDKKIEKNNVFSIEHTHIQKKNNSKRITLKEKYGMLRMNDWNATSTYKFRTCKFSFLLYMFDYNFVISIYTLNEKQIKTNSKKNKAMKWLYERVCV